MILSVNGPLQHGQHLHNPYFLGSQPKVMNFWLPHNCSNNCFVCLPSLNFHRLTLILNFPSHNFHSFLSLITSTHSVIHSILFLLHSSSHSSSSFHSFTCSSLVHERKGNLDVRLGSRLDVHSDSWTLKNKRVLLVLCKNIYIIAKCLIILVPSVLKLAIVCKSQRRLFLFYFCYTRIPYVST